MAFRCRADDDPTLNAGLVALCGFSGDPDQYCKETLYFSDFSGDPDTLLSPLDPPIHVVQGCCDLWSTFLDFGHLQFVCAGILYDHVHVVETF